jgi:hypothetical protein
MAQTGEHHHGAKLTAAEVRDIRRQYPARSTRALGREYGVSSRCIWKVVTRQSWKHVR